MNLSDYKPVDTCQIPDLEYIYESVFGLKSDGVFVEVGAFDGKTYSNTYQLAKLGWRGLYVEPVEHLYQACISNHIDHKDVLVSRSFVSAIDDEVVQMYSWGDNTFTGNADFIEHVAHKQVNKVCSIPSVRLSTLLMCMEMNPEDKIDLMVIDVEGHEVQVLQGMYIEAHFPTMMIIETHECAKHAGLRMHSDKINEIMLQHNYIKIYADEINSIFVRE